MRGNYFSNLLELYNGRAQRGVCTAEDGRRGNVVQLRTLKRTRLASREHVCLDVDNLDTYTEHKKNHFLLSNSTIASNEFPVDNFECAHSDGKYAPSKKQNRIVLSPERKEFNL